MSRLKHLIQEVHHRSLWQVLGIYVIGGWLVLQAVDTLAGALNLPEWAPPLALFLLIIGLPIVLATAFVQEGVGRREPGEVDTHGPGRRLTHLVGRTRGNPRLHSMSRSILLTACFVLVAAGSLFTGCSDAPAPRDVDHQSAGTDRHYVAYRATDSIVIDGTLDESSWTLAPWTEPFVDIEGDRQPTPRWRTRVAMVWDDRALYIAATMEEPHLWATITARDAVIYHDNDFEVFLDPDGDTHAYYELEINALGTVWDLFLDKPYHDGGSAVNEWDIGGLESAVALEGTLNDPGDQDQGWSVELAIPWDGLVDLGGVAESTPLDGDTWRVNFSRVEWQLDPVGTGYAKRTDQDGAPIPEDNWVWSPQGAINMHMPEMWGRVQFSDQPVGDRSAEPR